MLRKIKNEQAFTIVELLVVIVVISILAAVSVVAYNGIRVRAEAATYAATASNYQKILASYYVENGDYPATINSDTWQSTGTIESLADSACLGDGYAATSNFSKDVCEYKYYARATKVPSVDAALETIATNLPTVRTGNEFINGDWRTRGISYFSISTTKKYQLSYTIPGDASCGGDMKKIPTNVSGAIYTICDVRYSEGVKQ